jgi:hypothetical protein
VIYARPGSTQLVARIVTWNGTALDDELNRIDVPLANLPSSIIPAGYTFGIHLGSDSSNGPGTIHEVGYTASSGNGTGIPIVGQTLRTTGQPATVANLAPIAAFQFNIGGDYGGNTATLAGGWGTIAFRANDGFTRLHVAANEPTETDFNDGTAENANLIFGALPGTPGFIRQWFQATTDSAPKKRAIVPPADGRPRHFLPPPDDSGLGRPIQKTE